MITAYITNAGKYGEGFLYSQPLKLPATQESLQNCLKQIKLDGKHYEEYFISEYESDISGLAQCLPEFADIDELNFLAALIDDLDDSEKEVFMAAIQAEEYTGSIAELINLVQNLDCYSIYPEIQEQEELGRYYIDELESLTIPDNLYNYFDFEAYGRDMCINENGEFTKWGYIFNNRSKFIKYYDGKVPDEYKIFQFPEQCKKRTDRDAR